jgi:hypothetical protein
MRKTSAKSRKRSSEAEERKMLEKVKPQVKLSPFFTFDAESGEVLFAECPPCPKCDFWEGGEYGGSFQCNVCGFNEVPKYSDKHGQYLFLEGLWKILRVFLVTKRLRWEASFRLCAFHGWWQQRYLQGRKRITYTSGNAIWSWKEKKWKRWDVPEN